MGRQSRVIQEPKDRAKPTRHETATPPQSEQVCPATTATLNLRPRDDWCFPEGRYEGGGPQADGHGGRSPPSGHGSIARRPFEGAARNRSTRAFPDHRGGLHVTNCEAPSLRVPELGAREAHRASPAGLPLVPRLSNNTQLMVLKMPRLQQPEAQDCFGLYLFISSHLRGTCKQDSGSRFACFDFEGKIFGGCYCEVSVFVGLILFFL